MSSNLARHYFFTSFEGVDRVTWQVGCGYVRYEYAYFWQAVRSWMAMVVSSTSASHQLNEERTCLITFALLVPSSDEKLERGQTLSFLTLRSQEE